MYSRSSMMAAVTAGQVQQKIDTIANNMANVNTTGFKRREAMFSDLLHQQINNQSNTAKETGRLTPYGLRVGSGARLASTTLRLEQGPLQTTERELDFAITEKNHFFRIGTTENDMEEARLTKDGTFYLSEDPDDENALTIVTSDGHYLLDGGFNRITVPATFESLQLTKEGTLTATLQDGTIANLGQLALTHVHKPQLLEATGDNLYRLPNFEALGLAPADVFEEVPGDEGRIVQGALEGSNVDLGNEMSELILAQRHYQFLTRSLSVSDEMSGLVNGIRR